MQVTVEYTPEKAGDHNGEVVLNYDTGKRNAHEQFDFNHLLCLPHICFSDGTLA